MFIFVVNAYLIIQNGVETNIAKITYLLYCAQIIAVAFSQRLRFDRVMPQPLVWDLADMAARHLAGNDLIALILPGDNGSVSLMLEAEIRLRSEPDHQLRFVVPKAAPTTLPEALDEAAISGVSLAVVSCVSAGLSELPPGSAALVARRGNGWMPLEVQRYPPAIPGQWRPILAPGPFCGE